MEPRVSSLIVAAALAVSLAPCRPAAAASSVIFKATMVDIVVQPDGTAEQTIHQELYAANDVAAAQVAQIPLSFSPSMETMEVVEAYTLKPDGRRIAVSPAAIQEQAEPVATGAPMFSDRRRKTVVFPEVAGGDTMVLTARRQIRVPQLPGLFQATYAYPRTLAYDHVHVSVHVPTAMQLRVDTLGPTLTTAEAGGTTTYTWDYRAPDALPPTPTAIAPFERAPHIVMSTMQDWETLGRAYRKLADPKAAVTPKTQALADEITAGTTDRRQQAERLYTWVSLHIRYVAVFLANGALEPHAADAVLANGYGDCKDHVVLFETLLRAKGIPSVGALINSGNGYTLTKVPSTVGLDHIITYIPEFDLYADTTMGVAPFGVLGFAEYGKPVVLAVESGPAVRRTPLADQASNSETMRAVATLSPDGRIDGQSRTDATGAYGVTLRHVARGIAVDGADGMAEKQLKALGLDGTGHLETAPSGTLEAAAWINGRYSLKPDTRMMDGGEFALPTGLRMLARPGDGLIGPLSVRDLSPSEPTPCFGGRQLEELSLTLPEGRKIARLPKDREVVGDGFRFTSHWAMDASVLKVTREMVSTIDRPVCEGEQRRQTARALQDIRRDYAERVRFEDAP